MPFICRFDCTQYTMESDRTDPPPSELNRPFFNQQGSEQLTRPVFPQVSFNYRSAANSDYEYLTINS